MKRFFLFLIIILLFPYLLFSEDISLTEREQFAFEMFYQNEEIFGPYKQYLNNEDLEQLYSYAEERLSNIVKETRDFSKEEAHQYILEKIYGSGGLKSEIHEQMREIFKRKTLPSSFENDLKNFYLKYGKKYPLKIIISTIIAVLLLIYIIFHIIKNKIIKDIFAIILILFAAYLIYLILSNKGCSYQKIKKYLSKQTIILPKSDIGKNIYFVKPLINTAYTYELVEDINKAKYIIVVSMYLAELSKSNTAYQAMIFDALIKAAARNVKVYVMLDYPDIEQNLDLYTKNNAVKNFLENNKIIVIWDSPQIENHEKIILIDEQILYVCSHNWSYAALTTNEEISFKIYSYEYPQEILNYYYTPFENQIKSIVILEKLNIKTDKYFKTDDFSFLTSYKYFYKLKRELITTKKSVKIRMFLIRTVSMNEEDKVFQLLQILKKLKENGKDIEIILDASMSKENTPVYDLLKNYNINVRFNHNEKIMHTKLVIIDNEKIFCGSHNWTNSSFNTNREVSIYCKSSELAKYIEKNIR
ncbi:MAG TPA: phospholipase D-like domain-containing protein [bacterium]|nr:phospholipase D-like domain-containing protein [bacterium]HOL48599.1 phospholipase D-like domain-containing protein [bacterium]HPQ18583.1 phospholipase D-like domain-containing protein [bacterium]